MRRVLPLAALALAATAVVAPAGAHVGKPVLPDAIVALQRSQVYVDPDAVPTLSRLETGRLARSLPDDVLVAVLPAKAAREVAGDLAETLARNVGRPGAYLVVVGGELETVDAPATARAAFDDRRNEGLAPAVEAAVTAARQSRDGANWPAFAVSMLLGAAVLALLVRRSRRRAPAARR